MPHLNDALFAWLSVGIPTGARLSALEALAQWPIWCLPLLLGGLWLLGTRNDRWSAINAGAAALLAMAVAFLVSSAIDHPRPFMVGLAPNLLDHAADSSFPSDHATLLFALAAAFWLTPSPRVPWLAPMLMLTGLAVGWARVALGVHFPFDILAAAVIGAVSAAAIRALLGRPVALLMSIGETLRGRVPVLTERDRRQAVGGRGTGAHSAH